MRVAVIVVGVDPSARRPLPGLTVSVEVLGDAGPAVAVALKIRVPGTPGRALCPETVSV